MCRGEDIFKERISFFWGGKGGFFGKTGLDLFYFGGHYFIWGLVMGLISGERVIIRMRVIIFGVPFFRVGVISDFYRGSISWRGDFFGGVRPFIRGS